MLRSVHMGDGESSLLIEHKMDWQLEVRHQLALWPGRWGWCGISWLLVLLLVLFFQVTSYACILVEPFQGHATFSIDNLDVHNKSGFGLNSGQQICREIKICFWLKLSDGVCVCVCMCIFVCEWDRDIVEKEEGEMNECPWLRAS